MSFFRVPRHVGVRGNERADRLAREATKRAPPPSSAPFRDVFQSIRVAVVANWQRRWETGAATSKMGEVTTSASHP